MSDFCPLIEKKCKEHKCKFYTQIIGKDPNTGADVARFDCVVSWLPILLIEGSQMARHQSAAIESFRNEMVRMNETSLNLLTNQTDRKALENE